MTASTPSVRSAVPAGALEVAGAAAVPPPRRHPVVRADVPGHDVRSARGCPPARRARRGRGRPRRRAARRLRGFDAVDAGSAALTAQRVPSARGTCGARAGRPVRPRRVVWIVMENQAYSSVIGSRSAPCLNRLAAACGLATTFTAEAHPSLPNYLAMTSGSTRAITDDDGPDRTLGGPSIFSSSPGRLAGARGVDAGGRARSRTRAGTPCATTRRPTTRLSAPRAARRTSRCAAPDQSAALHVRHAEPLPRHALVPASTCDGVRTATLALVLPAAVLAQSRYRSGSTVVFITWDEDDGAAHQHIPTLVISPPTRGRGRTRRPRSTTTPCSPRPRISSACPASGRGAGDLDERGVRAGLNGGRSGRRQSAARGGSRRAGPRQPRSGWRAPRQGCAERGPDACRSRARI